MKTSKLHTLKSILEEGIWIKDADAPIKISCIYIPKIQRAYAQGRKDESDIRKDFLDALFDTLVDEDGKTLELSFLFGSKQMVAKRSAEGFELLDGQQRTTTLFLLYWYVSIVENNGKIPDFLKKFTYETRDTSTQFLINITAENFKICLKDTIPSAAIKSNKWFTDAYYCDPTVCAMLTMLDSIHAHYNARNCVNIYERLDRLQFYVLMLGKFDMNDELYIKMNSRGLSLVPFENFKASVVKYMKSEKRDGLYGKEEVTNGVIPFWFSFISDIDSKWIDLFWEYPYSEGDQSIGSNTIIPIDDASIGRHYFNFLNRYFFTKSAEKDSLSGEKLNNLTSFFYYDAESEKMHTRLFGWNMYETLFGMRLDEKNPVFLDNTIFNGLKKVLDTFHTYNDFIKECVTADPFKNIREFNPGADKISIHQRVIFAAVTEFIEKIPKGKSFDDADIRNNFRRMLRVIFNIIENSTIDSAVPTVRAVKLCKEMASAKGATSGNFYSALATSDFRSENRQFREEVIKAREMFSDNAYRNFIPEWEEAFKSAEANPVFKGSVLFFLTEKTPAGSYTDFTARYLKMCELFRKKDGITEDYRENHILIRAILSQLTKWSSFGNQFITEYDENNEYLKNLLVSKPSVRALFCSYFDNKEATDDSRTLKEYLNDKIRAAVPDENQSEGFKKLFQRLVTDEAAPHIFDWMQEREIDRGGRNRFQIIENRSSLMINMPSTRLDRIVLDTDRHLMIPMLVDKYSMTYCDRNQEKMIKGPVKDAFNWDIAIQKKYSQFKIRLTFNVWKWVDFDVYTSDVELLSREDILNIPIEKRHRDYVRVSSVSYGDKSKIGDIENELNRILSILEPLRNDSDINE